MGTMAFDDHFGRGRGRELELLLAARFSPPRSRRGAARGSGSSAANISARCSRKLI